MTDEAQIERATDSTVLRLLLDAREPWSMDELVRELQDLAARDAVGRLTQAGLVHRHDEFMFPTRGRPTGSRIGDCRLMTATSPQRKAKSGQRRKAKSAQHKLGEAIRASRNEQGYSQEGFAAHAGMDRSYYGAIERGGFNFTIETLMRVAAGLDAPAWEILRRADL